MKRLTPKQQKALPLLASGMTGIECAKIVGVKPPTVSDWINHCPAFAAALEKLRGQVSQEAIADLQASVAMAGREVRRLIATSASDAVRLKACEFVITNFGLPKPPTDDSAGDVGKRMNLNLILQGLGVGHVQ